MSKIRNHVRSIVAGSVLILASGFAHASTAHPGLIADYTFDGSDLGADSSGNNYELVGGGSSGTNINGPAAVAGKIGSGAANFDGTDDIFTHAAKDLFPASTSLSISFWVKTTDTFPTDANNAKNIAKTNQSNVGLNVLLSGGTATAAPSYRVQSGAGTTLGSGVSEDNNWRAIAITFDGASNTLEIYVDGALKNTESATYTAATSGLLGIGGKAGTSDGTGTANFLGSLDDFAVYSFALDTNQISDLANGKSALQVVPEPSSLTIVGMTGVCMLRRRRRLQAVTV